MEKDVRKKWRRTETGVRARYAIDVECCNHCHNFTPPDHKMIQVYWPDGTYTSVCCEVNRAYLTGYRKIRVA